MRKVLVAVLSLALLCTACSTAWVSTLDAILAAAAPALIDILEIVAAANGQRVSAAEVTKIRVTSELRRGVRRERIHDDDIAAATVRSDVLHGRRTPGLRRIT